jgi:hypothetical protein
MKHVSPLLVLVLIGPSWIGCGKSESTETANSTPETTAVATETAGSGVFAAQTKFDTTPDAAVLAFLEALRDGDNALAEALLTNKARDETSRQGWTVQPPGTPTAKFRIGDVDFLSSDKCGAHVTSIWSEQDGAGNSVSYEIVWALRQQSDGWRIAGMATQIADSEAPVFLNFEDPNEMMRKWKQAEERLADESGAAPETTTR